MFYVKKQRGIKSYTLRRKLNIWQWTIHWWHITYGGDQNKEAHKLSRETGSSHECELSQGVKENILRSWEAPCIDQFANKRQNANILL